MRRLAKYLYQYQQLITNTQAIVRQVCRGNATTRQQLLDYVISCIQPGYAYFESRFGEQVELHQLVKCLKAARLFSPVKLKDMQPSTTIDDSLAAFPVFDDPTLLCDLMVELAAYMATVHDVSPDVNILEWWKRHESQLPHFAEVVELLSLCSQVQPLLSGYLTACKLIPRLPAAVFGRLY